MKSSEYLKFMTERVVSYLDNQLTAADEDAAKPEKKQKEPWLSRWFGVIPMGIQMWWGKKEQQKQEDSNPEVHL